MVVDTSGKVGIGTTSPGAKLDVAGAVKLSDTGQNCGHAADTGAVRFNSSTQRLQYCVNGSGWRNVNEGPGVLISTQTASASASLQFTSLPTSYNTLFLNCAGLLPSANATFYSIYLGEGAGPTWETGAHYTYNYIRNSSGTITSGASTTSTYLWATLAFNTTFPENIQMYLNNAGSSSMYKAATIYDNTINTTGASNTYLYIINGYWNNDTNAITGIEIVPSTGNIASGTCSLYGMNCL
jgi:hypothetical protein